jgi:hypothetical protein
MSDHPPPTQRPRRALIAYTGVLLASLALLVIIPPPFSSLVLVALLVFTFLMASNILGIPLFPVGTSERLRAGWESARPTLIYAGYAVEIALICLVAYSFTPQVRDPAPELRLRGPEYSYLVSTGAFAAQVYAHSGAIPLWNPFMGRGEPMLESAFSYVLNPFMTIPIYLNGAVQGGKDALILHIFIIGLGGWLLAKALDCRAPGRLLLGLLLSGSGSFAGAIGFGFYQMSLSQAYIPAIYAGVIGALYRTHRGWIVLLATSATLLIFSGTFWYVLPTAIGAAALTIFALLCRRADGRIAVAHEALARLIGAAALTFLLASVRLIPQIAHFDLIEHPFYELLITLDFGDLFRAYFDSAPLAELHLYAQYYHYIAPPLLVGIVVLLRLWTAGDPALARLIPRWRIVLPAALLIALFTAWAQEKTLFMQWLYTSFPVLTEWRFLGRMMAAGSIWIAVLIAVGFDDVIRAAFGRFEWRMAAIRGMIPRAAVVAALMGVGAYAAADVLQNWYRAAGTEGVFTFTAEAIDDIRAGETVIDDPFIPLWSEGFFDYLPHFETLIRASFGNPDYRAAGVAPTLGTLDAMNFPPEYAAGLNPDYQSYLLELGYGLLPGYAGVTRYGIDAAEGMELKDRVVTVRHDPPTYPTALWHNPNVPTYVFAVHIDDLRERIAPLTRREAAPIQSYVHHIDSIAVTLGDYDTGYILVVQETAYPGWTVTIDGTFYPLESVGGLIGVTLPPKPMGSGVTRVVFAYEPPLWYLGAWVTLGGAILCALYLLRADRLLRRRARSA